IITSTLFACTRILKSGHQTVMVGRTMDWGRKDMNTKLWVYPRGILHIGSTSINPLKWISKYGSIVATAYDRITTDGINERGLAANILWLDEADYGVNHDKLPSMSVKMWAQFYLDNFQTVDEAIRFTESSTFQLLPYWEPQSKKWIKLHMSLEDAS